MTWFTSLFRTSRERTLARAVQFLDEGEFREALDELEGIEGADADDMRSQARRCLVQLNLHEWRAQSVAGDRTEAREALERARRFGASADEIKRARTSHNWEVDLPRPGRRVR